MIITIVSLIIIYVIFYSAIHFSFISIPQISRSQDLNISIVIAAKNEANNIPVLISSLKELDYPKEKFEIIIVDDNSDDLTLEILRKEDNEIDNLKVFSAENKKYSGKKGALDFGISKTQYENILITDADCSPETDWLSSFSSLFSEDYEIVFGAAPFYQQDNLINKISRFENLRNTILTFGLANLGFPYSAASRNFGFRKETFQKLKGYENTLETIGGDDDLLIREGIKHKAKFGFILNKNAFVFSKTESSWKDYFRQKFRHLSTSNYYLFRTKLILSLWHFLNLFFFISPFLIFFNFNFFYLFLVKLIFDPAVIRSNQEKLNYKFGIFEVFFLQALFEVLLVVNYFGGLFRKKKW